MGMAWPGGPPSNAPWRSVAVPASSPATTLPLPEWILYRDAEVLLSGVGIIRPAGYAATALSKRHNHAIIEVNAQRAAGLHRAPDKVSSRRHNAEGAQRASGRSHILSGIRGGRF